MISVLGAGAFGTALAVAMAQGGKTVTLWARNPDRARQMRASRENIARLPGVPFPQSLHITSEISDIAPSRIVLLASPAQELPRLLETFQSDLAGKTIVACSKGIDLISGLGPTALITQRVPSAVAAVLSGPSFANDIGAGLPTALTLAAHDVGHARHAQNALATPNLRIYSSSDPIGVEIGGALKNVVAIGCGAAIGAGLGESARAALMTRGFAEMSRFAQARGAQVGTMSGLAGFGDLALSASSLKSRNYRFGVRLGEGKTKPTETTEGIATAHAVAKIARAEGMDMPVALAISDVLNGDLSLDQAIRDLLARPVKGE